MNADAIVSPCIGLCRIDPRNDWCEGCLRTIDEISAWPRLDAAGKHQVLSRLPARRASAGTQGEVDPKRPG